MALYMDIHTMDGPVGMGDVAQAHAADLQTQEKYGVKYLRYWVSEADSKIFCLVDAPDIDAGSFDDAVLTAPLCYGVHD